jgi:hypothetical protein
VAQNVTSVIVVSTSTGRRPRWSVMRPITGAPSEPPTVNIAPTRPAAPYPSLRSSTTCRVSVTVPAMIGMRASVATMSSDRRPRRASVSR